MLRSIADSIGIGKYPDELDAIYESIRTCTKPACDIALIESLQLEYNLFEEYYETVLNVANAINKDTDRSAWIKTVVAFVKDKNVAQARRVPVPKADGTQITALLPLFVLLPQIPLGIESYRGRGFSDEEIRRLLKAFSGGIKTVESQTGMPGINALYYHWLTLYVKAAIFNTDGLQFELRTLPDAIIYLKNRNSGDVVLLPTQGTFHKSGEQILGSPGYIDSYGSFDADFSEEDRAYYGHPIINSIAKNKREEFLKADWVCVARPGDMCLSIHIPRGADISVENMNRAVSSAREIVKTRYPEHTGLMVFGSSWILDPTIAKLLGENSNISRMQDLFYTYPQKCGGMGAFGYVFPKNFDSFESLPENTSLQRKLKKHYINGGYIYDFAGLII